MDAYGDFKTSKGIEKDSRICDAVAMTISKKGCQMRMSITPVTANARAPALSKHEQPLPKGLTPSGHLHRLKTS